MKEDMKKLAIISGSDMRNMFGGEKYIIELTKLIKTFKVTVFSFRDSTNNKIGEEKIKKILKGNLEFFNSVSIPIIKERVPLSFSGFRMLSKLGDYDSIYITDPSMLTILFILLFLKLKKSKTKIVFGVHEPGFLRKTPNKATKLRLIFLKIYRPLYKRVMFKLPNMHVLNTHDYEMLKKEGYKRNIYLIPNFLYYKKPKKIISNKNEFVVLFVGRFSIYHKGIDILKKIIINTLKIDGSIKFHICGKGGDGEQIIKNLTIKYPKNVIYKGFLTGKEILKEYNNASIFILTSRMEGFPLVTLEAQANGLPVIAFDVKGPHDLIKKEFQGKLIKQFETVNFTKSILKYYKLWKKGKLNIKKEKIINYIFNRYSNKKVIPKIKKMLS